MSASAVLPLAPRERDQAAIVLMDLFCRLSAMESELLDEHPELITESEPAPDVHACQDELHRRLQRFEEIHGSYVLPLCDRGEITCSEWLTALPSLLLSDTVAT